MKKGVAVMKLKKLTAVVLSGVIAASFVGCGASKNQTAAVQELFTDSTKISYSLDYKELKDNRKNKTKTCR